MEGRKSDTIIATAALQRPCLDSAQQQQKQQRGNRAALINTNKISAIKSSGDLKHVLLHFTLSVLLVWCRPKFSQPLLLQLDMYLIRLSMEPLQATLQGTALSLALYLFMYTGQDNWDINYQSVSPHHPNHTHSPSSLCVCQWEAQLSPWCMTLFHVLCSLLQAHCVTIQTQLLP